jgi:hypothetical protein
MARLPSYIRAQRPRELHSRLPPSGHNTPSFEAPLERPLPSPVTEGEDSSTPHGRKARYGVNRQGEAGLHTQWG